MECQGCFNNFDNDVYIPRILIACGHTLCTNCIQKQLDKDSNQNTNDPNLTNNYTGNKGNMIKCVECEVLIQNIESPNQLPVNLALLQFSKNQLSNNQASGSKNRQDSPKRQRFEDIAIEQVPKRHRIQMSSQTHGQQVSLCETHDKKIEAFCDLDKKLLCIDCILNENHKNHEILALEKACAKEKQVFDMSLKTALQKETEVQHQILRIKNHLYELEESANKNRSEISKIFNEIRNKIIERETNLKKQISDTLEKEQLLFKQRIVKLEDQMKCIQDLKDEKLLIDNETILETLIQSPYRFEIEHDSNRRIDPIFFQSVFQDIKKDDEIANIVRAIVPNHLRTTLIQNTLSSQIKKKEKQEELKRREFSKQPQVPVYDQDHKFNYRKGYLREDKVPAFISTKQRKEVELVNNSTDIIIESKAMIGIVQKQTSTGQHGKQQSNNNLNQQQLQINTKQANSRHTMAALGSNDNSPRTQQQIMQGQLQKHHTQNFNTAIGSIQNANQKILRKQQTGKQQQQQPISHYQFDITNNESSVVSHRPSSIMPHQIHNNLNQQDQTSNNSIVQQNIKRASSHDRQNAQFQCTLPQSLQQQTKHKDSPQSNNRQQVKKHPSDIAVSQRGNMTPSEYLNNISEVEERKSIVNTPQKSAQKNKTNNTQQQQQQQFNQIFGSFDNKVRAVQQQQSNDFLNADYNQGPKTHRQQSKGTSNLAEVRSQKKQEKAKIKQQSQLPQQILFGSNVQHQSSVMSSSQISQQNNMSTFKKKGKKGKELSYFEFTNEKLFKQIIEKKNPNNISKMSKNNKSSNKNSQLKGQKKASQKQGIFKHSESSDLSQNKTNSNQDIDRQKSSLENEMREQIFEEDSNSQNEYDNESQSKIEEEFSQSTNKKRKSHNQQRQKYLNTLGNEVEEEDFNEEAHDDEDEEGHFINDDDFENPVLPRKISNYQQKQERSKSQSEDLDEEGIPEISSIHNSPQKRQSEIASQANVVRQSSSQGRAYMAHNIPVQSTFNTRKLEDHFDNDQSRINFAPDQHTINDNDRDLMSFRLEFDLSVKDAGSIMEGAIGQNINSNNDREDISLLNQFKTPNLGTQQYQWDSQATKTMNNEISKQSMTIDFDNLFKMKEEYIFVFSGFNERFLTSVEVFDVTRGIWREFKDACPNRAKFQVQALNDETILIFGGKDEFGIQMDDVEDFGIKEMKAFPGDWRLPQNISGFSSCQIKPGVIAICGGNTGQQVSNKFFMVAYKSTKSRSQRIEQDKNNLPQITEMPPMIQAREEFALVLGPDQRLYAIGGYNPQDGCLSSVEAFDFQTQQWQVVTQMEEGKRALNAVALPDGIYVLGGYNGREYLSTVQKYDIFAGKWSDMRPMNTNRGTFSTLLSQNCNYIYAIGGFNGQPLDHVERYDAMNNQWEYLAPMKQKRFMHAACIANIEKKK